MKAAGYERWVWIELIGFDNTVSDCGVAAYLDNVGFIPDGISLLLYTPDFVHAHEGMDREWTLPIEMCSYGARPYGKERNRQEWTNYQLRNLVEQLQKHSVEIYCSFFDIYQFHVGDTLQASKWCAAHPELYEMKKTGEAFPAINPLRRFKDGSYYEDLFVNDLMKVMLDYGFDGYHGADGYTSPRLSLAETDYSDDMVEQFVAFSGVELGKGLEANCDGNPLEMEKRAEWIWKNRRIEWISFHGSRWGQLWHKIMPALHKEGKKAVVNTAWTRDPFEALYRFGVDYRLLADTGVDGFIVESVGASLAAGAGETEYEPGPEFMAMLLTIKAYVPDKKLICLNAIQDTNEQWDALSHAPTVLERDIYSLSNVYLQGREGLSRCASGFMACLGDGITRDGWNWISKRWDSGFDACPSQIVGASMVWSDQVLHHSLEDYSVTRDWHVHKYMKELITRGAPLHTVVNIKDIDGTTGLIFVTHLHLLPDDELQSVLTYRGGPAILIGHMTDRISQIAADAQWEMECEINQLFCVMRDTNGQIANAFAKDKLVDSESIELNFDSINDSVSWIDSLYFNPVTEDFLTRCVQGMIEFSGAPKVLRNEDYIRPIALEMTSDRWRLLILNLHMNYKSAHLNVGRPIANMNVLTDFPGIPITPRGSEFSLYVPGRGMVMVELVFKKEE